MSRDDLSDDWCRLLTHLTGLARELLLVARLALALGSGCTYFFLAAAFEAAAGFYFGVGAGDFAAAEVLRPRPVIG